MTAVQVTAQTEGTVSDAIVKQFREEIGTDVQQFNMPAYNARVKARVNTPAEDRDYMLRQKYGMLPAQLTHSEKNLIQREELKRAKRIK